MKTTRSSRKTRRLGVWLVGARGGLASTLITGSLAHAKGHCSSAGLLTSTEPFSRLPLVGLDKLVFGGHDIRRLSTREAALEVAADSGSISELLIRKLSPSFRAIDAEILPGTTVNAGPAIDEIADEDLRDDSRPLREIVGRVEEELRSFQTRKKLNRVIVVNLSSTEAPLRLGRKHAKLDAFERVLDADEKKLVRPSTIYAYAAAKLGMPFLHFTPSNATLIPAICELFEQNETPYMGRDGKTGETLVKSALAPLFRYRNLEVLAWQGYNILGDRDGRILDSAANKSSKLETKDSLLAGILGYEPHTKVAIDYVPSLGDLKTAWDFIHFRGFLDFKMRMQFIWEGCDAILAAPLILDMLRLADLAAEDGESGPMRWLAAFFKRPHGVDNDDLHEQWHMLENYVKAKLED